MNTRRALTPPSEPVVIVSQSLVDQALEGARGSERQRMILPFHKSDADPLHRMFNAMQPGTYVQPHRHLGVPKAEVFLVLRGAIDLMVFDEQGAISQAVQLVAGGAHFGVDLAPGVYHAFFVRETDTVLYEVKLGPYSPVDAKDFASWAPAEGSPEVPAYVRKLEQELAGFWARG